MEQRYPSPDTVDPARARIRILTWNIRKGRGTNGDRVAVSDLAQVIEDREPDVLLCQEVFHSASQAGPAQSDDLAEHLEMSPAYGPNALYRRGNHGNATFSRLPLERFENHDLSTNRIEKRGLLYTRVRIGGSPLHVFNTHLGLNGVQRRKQVTRIADLIEELARADEPLVLAGDFNDWTGKLHRRVLRRCGVRCALQDLTHASRRSWPSRLPVFGLDRVYFRHLSVDSARVLRSAPFNRLSDHLPIEAELSLLRSG